MSDSPNKIRSKNKELGKFYHIFYYTQQSDWNYASSLRGIDSVKTAKSCVRNNNKLMLDITYKYQMIWLY